MALIADNFVLIRQKFEKFTQEIVVSTRFFGKLPLSIFLTHEVYVIHVCLCICG